MDIPFREGVLCRSLLLPSLSGYENESTLIWLPLLEFRYRESGLDGSIVLTEVLLPEGVLLPVVARLLKPVKPLSEV